MVEDWENKLKQKELPDIKYFHSSLNNTKSSTDDYSYVKEIYNYFDCEEISDYNNWYVKTEAFILADVFSAYRKKMHQIYGLQSLYCISTPGFTNRAMLRTTSDEIKLMTDLNMHLMIENWIRGGRCEPIYYHAKANNKYINPNFNNEKESGEIKFDYNISNYTDAHILNLNPYGEYLFAFVIDIYYPKKLHDRDFEFPILCDQSIPPNDKVKKLISTFYDKKNYTLSLHMLRHCLRKGLKLKKIYQVMYAKQSNFMKSYISLNNEKRTEYSTNKDKISVEPFKRMSNANFGKQIEDIRKYKDARIANNVDKAKKVATKVTLNEWHILPENVLLYKTKKPSDLLDKPTIIGLATLEIAKLEMNIHYDRLKEIFGDHMRLLYTDTDSLKLLIKNINPCKLNNILKDYIDTSNFPSDTVFPLELDKNKKRFGCLKFENGDCPCEEYNSKVPKTYKEKWINQIKSIKEKGLKQGF